jgi:hypothetical protein
VTSQETKKSDFLMFHGKNENLGQGVIDSFGH